MKNKVDTCITPTNDSLIKFEENNRKIITNLSCWSGQGNSM